MLPLTKTSHYVNGEHHLIRKITKILSDLAWKLKRSDIANLYASKKEEEKEIYLDPRSSRARSLGN